VEDTSVIYNTERNKALPVERTELFNMDHAPTVENNDMIQHNLPIDNKNYPAQENIPSVTDDHGVFSSVTDSGITLFI
jgi:hypothetical protein